MKMLKAFFFGIRGGRAAILAVVILYLATLIFSTLAQFPLNRGFHGALDEAPTASGLATDDRLDVFLEMTRLNPSLLPAGVGSLVVFMVLFAPFALFLLAGVYSQTAGASEGTIRGLWRGGVKFFLPFALLFLFNLAVLCVMVVLIAILLAAVSAFSKGNYDTTMTVPLIAIRAVIAALLLNFWRNSVGYTHAHYVLRGEIDGFGRSFLKGFLFTLRRLFPVNLLTWVYHGLRALAVILFGAYLWSGFETTGAWFMTALGLQFGFFLCIYIRVAEVRTQVDYLRRFLPEPEREAEAVAEPEPEAYSGLEQEFDQESDTPPAEDPEATQLVGTADGNS